MTVPFIDLAPVNDPHVPAILQGVADVAEESDFTNGAAVAEFEAEFAAYCRTVGPFYCASVASGLDALRLALLALNVGPGSRVAVPAMTFVATWEAVTQCGATIVPVDVDEDGLLDAALCPRDVDVTVAVHLYGRLADMPALRARGPRVVEDACQAHGAWRDFPDGTRLRAGSESRAAAFSFYPTKPLGGWGDGGAVVTCFDWLDRGVRVLREHGQSAKNVHDRVGWTSRFDTVQAVVLLPKLGRLNGWNAARRGAARLYDVLLRDVGDLRLPPLGEGDAFHVYAVRTADPDGLAAHLADRGVGSGRHYPVPPHLTPAYAHLGYRAGEFPVAERVAAETLSLPLWAGIPEAQQVEVASAVRAWFDG